MRQDLHCRNIWKQLSLPLPPEVEQDTAPLDGKSSASILLINHPLKTECPQNGIGIDGYEFLFCNTCLPNLQ